MNYNDQTFFLKIFFHTVILNGYIFFYSLCRHLLLLLLLLVHHLQGCKEIYLHKQLPKMSLIDNCKKDYF